MPVRHKDHEASSKEDIAMKTLFTASAAFMILAGSAWAQGDATNGEKEFRKCKACHSITGADGTVVVKGGKTGPDLGGVVGRKAGSVESFKYSDALVKLGEAGEVWNQEDLMAYMTDPNKYTEEKLGDPKLKTKMTFKLNKNQADVAAFLAQNSPAAGAGAAPAAAPAAPAASAPAAPAPAPAAPAN
ncbi:c-type cytochrome [Paracoccus pacificus]|uniref:C-type cytochrome n=1 Tax=Paracoccus pacificus TaxID=1463598 RepID=A0ABW4RBQ0_9RHOB